MVGKRRQNDGGMRNVYTTLVRKLEGNKPPVRPRYKCIEQDFK